MERLHSSRPEFKPQVLDFLPVLLGYWICLRSRLPPANWVYEYLLLRVAVGKREKTCEGPAPCLAQNEPSDRDGHFAELKAVVGDQGETFSGAKTGHRRPHLQHTE